MPIANSAGERSYIAQYIVQTDSKNDGPITVRDAPTIPAVNDPFGWGNDFDFGAYATDYSCELKQSDDSYRVWIVSITYTTRSTKRNDDYQDNPTDKPAIISGGGIRFTRPVTEDTTLNPIATSAGEPLTDVFIDDSRNVLRIQKNFTSTDFDLDNLSTFADCVNADTFFGRSARKWKMDPIEWEERYLGTDSVPFYTVTFRFQGRNDTWDLKVVDRGSYYNDANGNPTRFKANGIVLPKGNLDGDGGELDAGLDVVHKTYEVYLDRDFSTLGIPTDFGQE